MAYTTIDDPSEFFNTILYTGDGNASGARSITGVGFKPDWVWIKERDNTAYHNLFDSNRGVGKVLHTNVTDAEGDYTSYFTAFGSDGFTLENNPGSLNGNTDTYVAWNWKANGGTTSSNSDGSITSTVQANTTAGFSIVTYTGNGTSGATIGHGLNSAPEWTIIKRRSDTEAWPVWHTAFGSAQSNVRLNGTDAVDTSSSAMFNNTFPTSSLITLGNGNFVNTNTETYVAYCFSEVKGYSKFGSYTGNSNADGTFVYTGFKPAWIMIKHTGSFGGDQQYATWGIWDNKRATSNVVTQATMLTANTNYQEGNRGNNSSSTLDALDMLSNGFKIRNSSYEVGQSGTYIYMAFAEHPFVSSKGVPVTAR